MKGSIRRKRRAIVYKGGEGKLFRKGREDEEDEEIEKSVIKGREEEDKKRVHERKKRGEIECIRLLHEKGKDMRRSRRSRGDTRVDKSY